MAGLYFSLGLISLLFTWVAVVQARRVYWLAPLYFLVAWLAGELALIHLLWQVGLTALLASAGVLGDCPPSTAEPSNSEVSSDMIFFAFGAIRAR